MRIWPRLSRAIASSEWERLKDGLTPRGRMLLRDVQWRAIGTRADGELEELRRRMHEVAARHGYPSPGTQDSRARFDREAAHVLRDVVDTAFADAASGEVWSYVACAVLPELTIWRFGLQNKERWVGTDLTRHAWARLWWQAEAFRPEPDLLGTLSEGDLNQLFERRAIGGDPALVRALTRAFTGVTQERRLVIRDATKRVRRLLAFVETTVLGEDELRSLAEDVVDQSVLQLTGVARVRPAATTPTRAEEGAADESSRGALHEVPDRALGRIEPAYRTFRRPAALSAPQLLSASVLRSVVAGALQIEGPVTRRRLRRLVAGATDGQGLSSAARWAIDGAVDMMFDNGQIEIDDPFRSSDQSDETLRLHGTADVRIRPRGDRDLQDIPPGELIAVAALAPGKARVDRIAFLREFYGLQELSDFDRRVLLRAVMAAERRPETDEVEEA